jgi:hypothetical protein
MHETHAMTDDNFKTVDLDVVHITGGVSLRWWVTGERFVIPAADPPGHTIERRRWMQEQRNRR